MKIRYIKDYIFNSPDGKGQWAEISAYSNGENVALNKPVISSLTVNKPLSMITDGNDGNVSTEFVESTSFGEVIVDLEQSYQIEEIKVNHYWDGRIYGHIVSVSADGSSWYAIYNSEIDGTYASFHSGKVFTIPYAVDWINGQNVTIDNGKLTKISGGNGWNGGAKSATLYNEIDNLFIQVIIEKNKNITFGFTENSKAENYSNNLTYRFELKDDFTYTVYCGEIFVYKTGTYKINDVFKVELNNGIISFYLNGVFEVQNTLDISFPLYVDASIYTQGEAFTASINGGLMPKNASLDLTRNNQSYVLVPHNNSLTINGPMTMEFWIKLKSPLPNDYQVILDKGNISTSQYYVIHEARNGNNQIKYRFGNGHERTFNRPASIIGEWTHMAFVWDGSNMIFYENGELVAFETFPVSFSPNTMPLTFGRMSAGGAYLDAFLDNIRIWNVARTQQEINDNKDIRIKGDELGLIGLWQFDEGLQTIAFDSSLKGNHGTIINGAFADNSPIKETEIITDIIPIKLGELEVSNVFLGEIPITKIYLGDQSLL